MPHCNTDNFQLFLDEFSLQTPQEFKVIILDNGAFHKAKKLSIPDNIALIFLPPYSPELNAAEKVWAKLKRNFTNRLFKTLDALSDYLQNECISVTEEEIKSICAFSYIFSGNFWTVL